MRDVIVGDLPKDPKENSEEVWSVIDLKDENLPTSKGSSKNKSWRPSSAIKGATSVLGFVSSYKPGKIREEKSIFDLEAARLAASSNRETGSILMPESFTPAREKKVVADNNTSADKGKRKPFKSLFHKEHNSPVSVDSAAKSAKRHWGFKKWNKNESEDETAPLPLDEKSDSVDYLAQSPIGEGPDTKSIKRKLHNDGAPSDFFIDKVSH